MRRKIILIAALVPLLIGCHGKDRIENGLEGPRVFGSRPGDSDNFKFTSYPDHVKSFEFHQDWNTVDGHYSDGVNVYHLTGTVVGGVADLFVAGLNCEASARMKLHYIAGVTNYHFSVDSFSGCGVDAPHDDFCIDGSSLCGTGR